MRNITRFLCSSLLATCTATAFATSPGFYMGVMGGPASTTGSDQQVPTLANPVVTTTVSPRSNLFGSRFSWATKSPNTAALNGV